jgi:Tfp pilus assembly protein PilZ
MKQNENDGIEFEAWKGSEEVLEISRKSFRTPIGESDDITLQINNQSFEIINITPDGVGIYLQDTDVFSIGQIIDTITLHLEGTLLTFQGKVAHISPMDPDGFLYGIELIELLENNKRRLRQYIQKALDNLLTDSITESPRQFEGNG